MDHFDRNNSVNSDVSDNAVNVNDNNEDPDNNEAQNTDNENTATNVLHRNNLSTRDHLFQAMFSRIALIYDRTFPPFARRFIEFMLLITALSVLFVLIYIHLAFVKAPITCLDHFSFEQPEDGHDTSLKHAVIRVEILSNPPLNYGLFHSYSKEYDDMNAAINTLDNVSLKLRSNNDLSQMAMFLNVIFKRCHKVSSGNDSGARDVQEGMSQSKKVFGKENSDQNQSEGSFYRLFHFPINPIIEKAEYWREKLSVRAMAPFRQTFNELELFAKSVFAEEKYIMEYSLEYGLLRLSPQIRERLNIPVHFIVLDSTKDKCFGNSLSRFILQEFVGYDQIIIGSLKRLAERQSGKGYVRNVVSGEHYRFVNSWMSRTSYLAAGFIMIIFTLSVSMLLRYSHHQIFVFIVDLLRMLENNLQFSFPAAPLLTVVLALVGMEAIMSEFFNDTSTAFYTILIIWLADQYEAVCCRAYVSKRHWPRYFYLYHFAFYAYHYRFNGQFSGLALLCSWLFIQHSMFFFFHHYELPRLMQGIAVRAIMDSLIVERAENTSLTPSSLYHNEDDDNDMPGGDRRDDDDHGDNDRHHASSSNVPSHGNASEPLPRTGDHKPLSHHDNVDRVGGSTTPGPSGQAQYSDNNCAQTHRHEEGRASKTTSVASISLLDVMAWLIAEILSCQDRLLVWSRTVRLSFLGGRVTLPENVRRCAGDTLSPIAEMGTRTAARCQSVTARCQSVTARCQSVTTSSISAAVSVHTRTDRHGMEQVVGKSPAIYSLRKSSHARRRASSHSSMTALSGNYLETVNRRTDRTPGRTVGSEWRGHKCLSHVPDHSTVTNTISILSASVSRHGHVHMRHDSGADGVVTSHDLSLDAC